MGKRLGILALAAVAGAAVMHRPAAASISASATIAPQQTGANSYNYSLTLTNNGTTPIGTFWFAWIPAYDLLPTAPTTITSPAGWTGTNAPDDFGVASVQWVNTANPLQPGQSLSGFKFDTSDSPAVLGGTSPLLGLPVEQSYVYIGAPETDPGFPLIPTTVAVPEPASAVVLLLAAPVTLLGRRNRRRRIR